MRRLLVGQLRLEHDLRVVGEASHGEEAVTMALEAQPDVILMKLLMPGLNGPQATERILLKSPRTKVVMLTAFDGLESVGKLAGAFECLHTNDITPQELVAAIRRAGTSARCEVRPQPAVVSPREAVERLAASMSLTARETRVLEQVACTELTVQQIAFALSSDLDEKVTASSVRHTLDRVMTKLQLEPRTRVALVKRVHELQQVTALDRTTSPPRAPEGELDTVWSSRVLAGLR